MKFHILDEVLECKKYFLIEFLKKFLKKNGCYLYVIIDKNRFKNLYRLCLAINKNVFTNYFYNNKNLRLKAINLFGDLKINDTNISLFKSKVFNYNKIKIESKFSVCIFVLFIG